MQFVAAVANQELPLGLGLHALCDHSEPEPVGEPDGGHHYGPVLGPHPDPAHEGLVDLEDLEGEAAPGGQG